MTAEGMQRRAVWQIALLAAGFLVLVVISAASVILVNEARDDSSRVVDTVAVGNQISTVLLDIRRAESAARGYLLTNGPQFLTEHEAALAAILPGMDKLAELTSDNPVQAANSPKLKAAIIARLAEFTRAVDFVKRNDQAGGIAMLREAGASDAVRQIREISTAMRAEEDRLLALRTKKADTTQQLASLVTIIGSALVILLAGLSIFLVRRSAKERDEAQSALRKTNLNLEETVDERTADLREANEEIQRFAYIVSHDLRSPLVNIMGFTSELEEMRSDLFNRISRLSHPEETPAPMSEIAGPDTAIPLKPEDMKLSNDFSEALGFIKSSIGKMDRLISAILSLTREGRREFHPERVNMRELMDSIASSLAHQAFEADATIRADELPDIISDKLALEQIFSNIIDNALKYLKPGVPGEIAIKGRHKLGFAVFEITDNGRGIDPRDHARIFELFRRAGTQDKPGQGIGLAHVRALVRRLGGSLSVASELHKGSTFTITLPALWTGRKRGQDA